MKNNKLKTTVIILSLLLSLSIFAQGPGSRAGRQGDGPPRGDKPDATKILEILDTNNDDKIDKIEASKDRRGKISEDFDEIDTNSDGFITIGELETSLNIKKPRKVSSEKILKEVDDNEDGFLNELEVAAKNQRDLMDNFKEIDTNDDSQLDLEELKVFYSKNEKSKRKKRN